MVMTRGELTTCGLEAKPQIYQSLDSEGKIREVSRGWLDKFGYKKNEVINHSIFDFLECDDIDELQQKFFTLKTKGFIENLELKLRAKNGSIIEASLNGEAIYSDDGSFSYTICELKTLHYYVSSYAETLRLLQKETFHRTIADVAWRIASIDNDNPEEYIQEAISIIKDPLEILDIHLNNDANCYVEGSLENDMIDNLYFSPRVKSHAGMGVSDFNYYAILKVEGLDPYIHIFLNITPFMDTWWKQSLKILQKSVEQGYQRTFELQRRLIIEKHLEFSNDNLRQRIEEEIQKRAIKEQSLLQQSKMAAMGEMISNIAHQWRQPINSLGIIVQNLSLLYKHKMLDDDSMNQMENDMTQLIGMMSDTIDSFRNFFKPAANTEKFTISSSIKETLCLLAPAIANENIAINVDPACADLKIEGFRNELSQVILNILTNAKDALIANNIINPHIDIKIIKEESQYAKIFIQDNAGGIPENALNQIFDPFFTTKESYGTGIGLYMSKMIIENKFDGSIKAWNKEEGACFELLLPLI
jgi:PAS domain S-box-containing protein